MEAVIEAVGDEVGPPRLPDDEGEDVGPAPPKAKKRRVLEYEQQYLQALPLAQMYEKSYMHRDAVVQVAVARGTDFIITASVDGHIKFWKKLALGVEFAKHFKAHLGSVTGLAVSADGSMCASISTDKTVKVFDVSTFDMIAMVRLPYVPGCVEWIFKPGDAKSLLAVSDMSEPAIHVYDVRGDTSEPVGQVSLHMAPVTAMRYNSAHNTVISTDARGGC
jgi:peptidylprolyl isomerase domain and WD repeat-containing protein 1